MAREFRTLTKTVIATKKIERYKYVMVDIFSVLIYENDESFF